MKSTIATRLLKDAAWQAAHGNPKGAVALYEKLLRAGTKNGAVLDLYRSAYQQVNGSAPPHDVVFDYVYASAMWGSVAGRGSSGIGSADEQSESYREFLTDFIKSQTVTSVLDIGCGDWQIGRGIDWSNIDYTGVDVSRVVLANTRQFASPHVRFIEGDARSIHLPAADLVIIKDVLQHWSTPDIAAFLPRLAAYRLTLITNDWSPGVVNQDIRVGDVRPIDLSRAPFSRPGEFIFSYPRTLKRSYLLTRAAE